MDNITERDLDVAIAELVANGHIQLRIEPDGSQSMRITEKGIQEAADLMREMSDEVEERSS